MEVKSLAQGHCVKSTHPGGIQTDNPLFPHCRFWRKMLETLQLFYIYCNAAICWKYLFYTGGNQALMLVVMTRVWSTSWSLCGQDVPWETPDLCPLSGAQGWEVGAHYTESAGRRKQEAASLSSAALPGLSESSYTSEWCLLQRSVLHPVDRQDNLLLGWTWLV